MRCDRPSATLLVAGLCCVAVVGVASVAMADAEQGLLPEPPSRCDFAVPVGGPSQADTRLGATDPFAEGGGGYEEAYQDYASRYGLYDYESSPPQSASAPNEPAGSWNHDGWYGYTNMLEEGEPGEPVKIYDRWVVDEAESAEPSEYRDWPSGDAETSPAYAESYRYGEAYPDDEFRSSARTDAGDAEYDYWTYRSATPDAPIAEERAIARDDATAPRESLSADGGSFDEYRTGSYDEYRGHDEYGASAGCGGDADYGGYDGYVGQDDEYDGFCHEDFRENETATAASPSSESTGWSDADASRDKYEYQCGVDDDYESQCGIHKRDAADRAAAGSAGAAAGRDSVEDYGEYGRYADQYEYEYSPSYHFRRAPAWPEYAADQSLGATANGGSFGDYDYGYEYRPAGPSSAETLTPDGSAKPEVSSSRSSDSSTAAPSAGEDAEHSGPALSEKTGEDAAETPASQSTHWDAEAFDAEPSLSPAAEPSTSSGSAADSSDPNAAGGAQHPAAEGREASGASSTAPSVSPEYPEYDMYEWQSDDYETESDGYESNDHESKGFESKGFESNAPEPSHSASPGDAHSAADPVYPPFQGGAPDAAEPYRDDEEYYYGTSRYESTMEPTGSPRGGAETAFDGDMAREADAWWVDDEYQPESDMEDSGTEEDRWDYSGKPWSDEQSSAEDASWFVADESYDEASSPDAWLAESGSADGTVYGDPRSVSFGGDGSPHAPGSSSLLDYSGMDLTAWLPGELLTAEDAAMLRRIAWLCEEPIDVRHAAWANYLGSLGPEAVEVAVRFQDATGRSPLELVDDLNAAAGLLAAYRLVARGETGVDSAAGLLVRSLGRFSPAWVQAVAEMTCEPPAADSIGSAQAAGHEASAATEGSSNGWIVALVGYRSLGRSLETFRQVWEQFDARQLIDEVQTRQSERAATAYGSAWDDDRYEF